MPTLADLSARLREAVASQAYDQARALIPAYCELLETEFHSHAPSSREARRIAEEARELYQSMARSVVLDRAQFVTELQRLANLSAYLQPAPRTPHTCDLEG
ncbi:MAG TPA: hypothetical protein VN893_00235 [Bryobacteraceae bacterium]|nr:hypothetical protein [Bryobacteraceae bacterium]